MSLSPKFSERLTTVVSTLIAAALLAAGVTAQQARTTRPSTLERLESDLRFQIRSAFRMTPIQAEQRLQKLDAVLKDYRLQPRNAADQRKLADWLAAATARSIPGTIKPMPAAPGFYEKQHPEQSRVVEAERTVERKQPAALSKKPTPVTAEEPVIALAPARQAEASFPEEISILKPRKTAETGERTRSRQETVEPPKLARMTEVSKTSRDAIKPASLNPPTSQFVSVTPTQPPTTQIQVNLRELEARITGYHAGLDELQAVLIDPSAPTEQSIAKQIASLESLVSDYQFVKLYYESLNPEERRRVTTPRKLQEGVSTVRKQLQGLQKEVEADFLGEFDLSLTKRLTALSKRLDALATQVSW